MENSDRKKIINRAKEILSFDNKYKNSKSGQREIIQDQAINKACEELNFSFSSFFATDSKYLENLIKSL